MRLSRYTFTREDADRITRVLSRHGGARTLRDLRRRHRFWPRVIEAAESAGIVRIEERKPRIGRPSRVAVLIPPVGNFNPSANLPARISRPLSLSIREELFLGQYWLQGGFRFNRFQRGEHSAGDAYMRVFGRGRHMSRNTARSAGGRLARRSWMLAAWRLQVRLLHSPGYHAEGYKFIFPDDMRSAGREWQLVIYWLEHEFQRSWPMPVLEAAANARTVHEFGEMLRSKGTIVPHGLRLVPKGKI